jgi:hypothetical protein
MPRATWILLAVLLSVASVAAASPPLSERSPVRPGAWWDPARPGSGFELHAVGDQLAAGWFTYETDGRPVWYTAQGAFDATGTGEMALLRHAWRDGVYAGHQAVGSLRLGFAGAESITAQWVLGGDRGNLALRPFVFSVASPEVDRSGLWFNPAQSGWGLSLNESSTVFVATLFAYDADGQPRWWTGEGTPEAVTLRAYRGACPACPARPAVADGSARLSVSGGIDRLELGARDVSPELAPGLALAAAPIAQITRPAAQRVADRTLAAFDDEASLRRWLLPALESAPVFGGAIDFSPPPPHVAFSNTNVQENGVDEAGLVKSDGRFVYTFAHDARTRNALPEVRLLPVASAGAAVGAPRRFPLTYRETGQWMAEAGLYLDDARLVAITGSRAASYFGAPWIDVDAWRGGSTRVEIFDRSVLDAPRSQWFARFDGHLVSSRRVGDRLVLVLRHASQLPGIQRAPASEAQRAANRRLFDATVTVALLPQFAIGYAAPQPLLAPSDILLPPPGSQVPQAQFTSVVAIDLAARRVESALAIAGVVDAVYAAPRNIYLASARFDSAQLGLPGFSEPPLATTDVHRIAIDGAALRVVGSGNIEGHLGRAPDVAPLRFGESGEYLRVATSSGTAWGGRVTNRLSVLEPSALVPGLLRTVAVLPNARRPEPLGKPGELLYGTRFVGDRLYAVTFERVDPLYVVDLADPRDPRIAGAVDLPGFSDWLHPLPGGLLLGVGRDARTSAGTTWFQGLQLNLFDVRDAARPAVLQQVVVGKRGSESALLAHPHAYSELQPAGGALQLALPARVHDGPPTSGSGDWASYAWSWSGLLRYELTGSGVGARLRALEPLVAERAPGSDSRLGDQPWIDPAADGARSVLFPQGVVYVGDGRFWHRRADGALEGPL